MSNRDQLIRAALHGVAARHAPFVCPTGEALAVAVAELRAAATDASGTLRTDLLGEIAGIHLGAEAYRSEHGGVERGHAARAELVLAAGADPDVAQAWRAEGYQRARPVMPPRT